MRGKSPTVPNGRPVLIRLPQALIDKLDAMATANYTSRTTEVRKLVEAAVHPRMLVDPRRDQSDYITRGHQ